MQFTMQFNYASEASPARMSERAWASLSVCCLGLQPEPVAASPSQGETEVANPNHSR